MIDRNIIHRITFFYFDHLCNTQMQKRPHKGFKTHWTSCALYEKIFYTSMFAKQKFTSLCIYRKIIETKTKPTEINAWNFDGTFSPPLEYSKSTRSVNSSIIKAKPSLRKQGCLFCTFPGWGSITQMLRHLYTIPTTDLVVHLLLPSLWYLPNPF